ncbi:Pyridoxamine 5'-phosphate oxidase [Nocardioides scoriae]|uniref:Pyridoxine/pyridoxamine 5'-phosphate oxidase n=1 Tax=Nocardioides scoriae TaxID=642780 RepID=A0A1H1S9W4_9ACTN|nr:pyridoxamine 5'-phosphate oxidase [Nocardioides scoriae]SDS44752.1 Pyridoxamine 5'-phosphate oxidase [Nocardioides scoriae]
MTTPDPSPSPAHASERLASLRREYADTGLDAADVDPDPLVVLARWLDEAEAAGIHEPNAVVVASVSPEGQPSARIVLLKGLDERGLVFYTNYDSRKGHELEATGRAALLFPWHDLQRQVRVEGSVARVAPEESAAYFAQRPRGSQLGAWASPQSQPVASREELDERYAAVEQRFADDAEVPVPSHWGGYRVVPEVVELWQGRSGRMHDRLVYRRGADAAPGEGWTLERLAP